MKRYIFTLLSLFYCYSAYSQYDVNCLGSSGIHDYPEEVFVLEDSSFLVLHKGIGTQDSSLHLSKLSHSGENIWRKNYDIGNPRFLSINRYNDNIIIVGTEYVAWNDFTPFFLVLTSEGEFIDQFEFPEAEDYAYSNASSIVIDDNGAYFGIENKIYRLNSNYNIEILYNGTEANLENIKSFKKTEDNRWLVYCRFPWDNHAVLELDENFEEISRTGLSPLLSYYNIERVYWDSWDRIHIIGLDHWDFDNPPIWKIATSSTSGELLWNQGIYHDDMSCSFLGSIKEFENGYYLFGISQRGDINPEYVTTVYRFDFEGNLQSYFYLEGVGSASSNGSQDFYVSPEGEELFLAGYTDCDQTDESIEQVETFVLKLTTIPDNVITNVKGPLPEVASSVSVYPTIFINSIKIESRKEIKEIRVYDLMGQLCLTKKINSKSEVELSRFVHVPAMYLLVLYFEDNTMEIKRIIKKKI